MGFFGTHDKGISKDELEGRENLENRLKGVFGSTSIGKRKQAMLDIALKGALDTDSSRHGAKANITREEFTSIIGGMRDGNLISENEAKKLHAAADAALND